MMQEIELPEVIGARLRQFERGRKRLFLLRGLAECALLFCLGLLVLSLVEWVFHLRLASRIWLSGANYFLLGVALLWRVGLPLLRNRPQRQIARDFETAGKGRFQERILSAVEISESLPGSQPGVSRWMMARTVELAAGEISAVTPSLLIERAPAARAWRWAGASMLVLAAACLIPGFLPRAWLVLSPYASSNLLSGVELLVQPGNCRIRQGTPLEIKASGVNLPDDVRAFFRWDDGYQETVQLTRSGAKEFSLHLATLAQGFHYFVQAGEAESATFTVKVDLPPRIARMQVQIEPPAYTHWTNRIVEGGNAEFLADSRIRLIVEPADEKVVDAQWVPESLGVRHLTQESNRLVLDLQPTNEMAYQIQLTGANQLRVDSPHKWLLRPMPDQPPLARLSALGAEPGMVQRDEILPLQALASDDVGLKRVDLVVLDKDFETEVKPIYAAGAGLARREVRASVNYNLADLGALVSEEVQFQLVAIDLLDQTNRSEPLSFTIGTRDKFLEAQVAARLKQLLSDMALQIDSLQQTRASWLSIARNYRDDDPASQLPAVSVLKSRLVEFGRDMQSIGQRLVGESETNNLPDARFMYRLGSTIAAWGPQQEEVLLGNCARVEQSKGTNVFEIFNLGGELFHRALINLEQYKQVVTVLQGVFETDILATRCESAQGRYKRGFPILRSENEMPLPAQAAPGLLVTFFEGVDLTGKVLEQMIDLPRFDNYAPANRHEQWSCRYEGDIQIAEDGDWTLACKSDDGVRLFLDGKSVLPPESWKPHPATQFQADLKLNAGWHPLVIEFFQGYGESKLQFLAGRKGQELQEVPAYRLRPPPDRRPKLELPSNAVLGLVAKATLKDRVRNSLTTPASVPPTLIPMTTEIQNENFARLVLDITPMGQTLATNLAAFASWNSDDSHKAEVQADALTAASKTAQRILREELDKYRWRFEGAAALKEMEHAVQELRDINQDLRQQPRKNNRSEQARSEIQLAKTWNKELQRTIAAAAHQFFDTAKSSDATLAQRFAALNASTKADKELQPLVEKLSADLNEDRGKDEFADQIERRLNQISDRYRELNELQEKINREQVAAEARQAFPPVRAFARAQKSQNDPAMAATFDRMKQSVDKVLGAQRVVGDYEEAQKLSDLAGDSPHSSKGSETPLLLRDLAGRTDRNPASLAQTIPPPMRREASALEQPHSDSRQSANQLATPRLAMALESSRLMLQADRKTAVAYALLGEDLGALVDQPDNLNAPALKPLADRAAALAGEKGEEARQAEIRAANQRFALLATDQAENPEVLAERLDDLSALAKQAAGEAPKRQPLMTQLEQMSKIATPVADWAQSSDAREIAASAADESSAQIQAAPNQWESYNGTSQTLADAARQIRLANAVNDLAALSPYPAPLSLAEIESQNDSASADRSSDAQGKAGQASGQAAPRGVDQAEWARLTERMRQAIRSSGIENFSQEHQAAIRAYFERLSSDSQDPPQRQPRKVE
jgi:hypothetical protein